MSLQTYLDLVTGEHNQRPNFVATLSALVQPLVDTSATLASMSDAFDIDLAVGNQLDIVGLWTGASRYLQVAITGVYFAWDTAGVGWDQGVWLGPGSSPTSLTVLPDGQFRTLIHARIINNGWDGTIPGAYEVGEAIFGRPNVPSPPFMFRSIRLGGDFTQFQCGVVAGALSPDGTTNARTWTRTNVIGFSYIGTTNVQITGRLPLTLCGTLVTFSLFAKRSGGPNQGRYVSMGFSDNSTGTFNATFDLQLGVLAGSITADGSHFVAAGSTAAIAPRNNGYYRCSVTTMMPAASLVTALFAGYSFNQNGTTWPGTDSAANTDGLVYGTQLEQGTITPFGNDLSIVDNQDMTMIITVRGPALDALTHALLVSGELDLSPAGVGATYNIP